MNLDGLDRKLIYKKKMIFSCRHHFVASKLLMKSQNLDDGLIENPFGAGSLDILSGGTEVSRRTGWGRFWRNWTGAQGRSWS